MFLYYFHYGSLILYKSNPSFQEVKGLIQVSKLKANQRIEMRTVSIISTLLSSHLAPTQALDTSFIISPHY